MRVRALLVVSTLAAVGLVPVAGAASCIGVKTAAGTTTVFLPQRPSSDTTPVIGFSLDPRDPQRAWVWTSYTVMMTSDGGCSWFLAFEADRSLPVGIEIITSVVPNGHPGSPNSALLLSRSMLQNTSDLYFSDDGRTKWTVAAGLPATGKIVGVAPSPVDPKTAFFSATQASVYVPRTYATSDGGRTWAPAQSAAAMLGVNPWRIHPHPSKAGDLWATSADPGEGYVARQGGNQQPSLPLYRSVDGGASWAGAGPTNVQLLEVVPSKAGARVAALDYIGARKLHVSDDGTTFTAIDVPELGLASMAHGRDADDTFLASASGEKAEMYRWDKSSRTWKVFAKGGGFAAIQSHRRAGRIYWLRGDKLMYTAY